MITWGSETLSLPMVWRIGSCITLQASQERDDASTEWPKGTCVIPRYVVNSCGTASEMKWSTNSAFLYHCNMNKQKAKTKETHRRDLIDGNNISCRTLMQFMLQREIWNISQFQFELWKLGHVEAVPDSDDLFKKGGTQLSVQWS